MWLGIIWYCCYRHVLLGIIGMLGCYQVLLGIIWYYWVSSGIIGNNLVLLGMALRNFPVRNNPERNIPERNNPEHM